ncbi:glycoside hydrolase family 18 protein [Laetiporus sulphureus 93-53]|uniref:Glycoside hydrolase family 18 protein n=1 Tax=Laetiporus sulphureus 93-53 TaxID=1314785 RepID=A0A165GEE3_9APHY|nr:glycoside hydrolase family 18 protein [Laetiporus sulphureus 93-53]KZT10234.1 glycoside hydrolase family 18 protein [Laetiporus sulphureus 93-53]
MPCSLSFSFLTLLPLAFAWAVPFSSLLDTGTQSILAARSSGNATVSYSDIPSGQDYVAMSWFAGWDADGNDPHFSVTNISWEKYNVVSYAMAATTANGTFELDESDQALLHQFVEEAHKNNVMALLALGGWDGSRYFSSSVATPEARSTFAQAIYDTVKAYDLDGIDFDWEYPNNNVTSVGCNVVSPSDTANFLSLLQYLSANASSHGVPDLILTAAVGLQPWLGADGTPLTDVSAFAEVLSFVEMMAYDVWGSWSAHVGPNSPLYDACAEAAYQKGSAQGAVDAWTQAGFPVGHIVLGVPGYGRSFVVDRSEALEAEGFALELRAYPTFSGVPSGDSWDSDDSPDACGVVSGYSGVYDFWGLVEAGFLDEDGSVAGGIWYRYDNCSQTPYVWYNGTQVMVSYDNAESFRAKGNFIKDKGLLGFAIWQAGSDYNNILVDSILETAISSS